MGSRYLEKSIVHDDEALYAQQVSMLFAQAAPAFTGGVVTCLATLYVLWGSVPAKILLGWSALVIAANFFLLGNCYYYYRDTNKFSAARLFGRLYSLQSFLHGASWGALPPMMLVLANDQQFTFALIVVLGLASGALATTGAILRVYLYFLVPLVFPSAVAIFMYGDTSSLAMLSALCVFFIGIMTMAAMNYNRGLRDSWRLQLENRSLYENLLHEQSATERALEKLRDEVAERQRAEGALREAMHRAEEASAAKSRFLANMSHEMRTPLTAIIGFGETLLDAKTTIVERIENIRTVIRNGVHLQQLINDLLDLSKIEAGKLSVNSVPADYLNVLHDIEVYGQMQAKVKGIDFKMDYRFPLPRQIITDEFRLKQILLNLCSNALKFTEKGSVRLKVVYDAEASRMRMEVLDTGIGLSGEQLSRLFQSFEQADSSTTRKYGGTGLGLAVSRRLANMLGGDIFVESELGSGSRFVLDIRAQSVGEIDVVAPPKVAMDEQTVEVAEVDICLAGNILVVEDTPDIQRLIGLYLNRLGVRNSIANNGEEGVREALRGGYDAVLMDMQMPVMDGIQAARALRAAGFDKPIIALTANTAQESRSQTKAAGFTDFLSKPLNRVDLVAVLAKYLALSEKQREEGTVLSDLIDENPMLSDMVLEFIESLPGRIKNVEELLNARDWRSLKERIHDLKGMGGSFGFQPLSELAKEMEFQAAKQAFDEVQSTLKQLQLLVRRIAQGRGHYENLLKNR